MELPSTYKTTYSDTRNSCIYNRLPEDKPLGSKHVEDIKN